MLRYVQYRFLWHLCACLLLSVKSKTPLLRPTGAQVRHQVPPDMSCCLPHLNLLLPHLLRWKEDRREVRSVAHWGRYRRACCGITAPRSSLLTLLSSRCVFSSLSDDSWDLNTKMVDTIRDIGLRTLTDKGRPSFFVMKRSMGLTWFRLMVDHTLHSSHI